MRNISRRSLLAGVTGLTAGVLPRSAKANAEPVILRAHSRTIEVLGRSADVFGISGPDGKTGINMLLGQRFAVRVQNDLTEPTVLHWHGLTPPNNQDGVPMLTQDPIAAGATYDYNFENLRSGTHWMHSHLGLQEQTLLAAPLIIRETAEPLFDTQEHTVLLHDFTFRPPAEILAELKSGMVSHNGHGQSGSASGIVYDALLANDRTFDDPEIVQVAEGATLRLRIINGAAATNMWIDTGTLTCDIIAVDGNSIVPIRGQKFAIAVAQRVDLRIAIPKETASWPIIFQAEGGRMQTGIILRRGAADIRKQPNLAVSDSAMLDLDEEFNYRSVLQFREEPVNRTETIAISGGGADYVWALNGLSGMHDTLFTVREGERVEVVMKNLTNMSHPMHLHGHYFKVVGIGERRINGAFRDTILIPPSETVAIQFDADNPGHWAFHCHHLYHMNAGMMAAINYSSAA